MQAYWEEPAPPPSAEPGMHRFALNVASPTGFGGGGFRRGPAPPPPVDACHPAGTTASAEAEPANPGPGRAARGLQPGAYTVKLTVDGQTFTQPVTVKPDPRNLPEGIDATPRGNDDDM